MPYSRGEVVSVGGRLAFVWSEESLAGIDMVGVVPIGGVQLVPAGGVDAASPSPASPANPNPNPPAPAPHPGPAPAPHPKPGK